MRYFGFTAPHRPMPTQQVLTSHTRYSWIGFCGCGMKTVVYVYQDTAVRTVISHVRAATDYQLRNL